eukprot:1139858-Pelagomonas_calceolata.AAC.3
MPRRPLKRERKVVSLETASELVKPKARFSYDQFLKQGLQWACVFHTCQACLLLFLTPHCLAFPLANPTHNHRPPTRGLCDPKDAVESMCGGNEKKHAVALQNTPFLAENQYAMM